MKRKTTTTQRNIETDNNEKGRRRRGRGRRTNTTAQRRPRPQHEALADILKHRHPEVAACSVRIHQTSMVRYTAIARAVDGLVLVATVDETKVERYVCKATRRPAANSNVHSSAHWPAPNTQDEQVGAEYHKQAKALLHALGPSANPLPLKASVKSDPFVFQYGTTVTAPAAPSIAFRIQVNAPKKRLNSLSTELRQLCGGTGRVLLGVVREDIPEATGVQLLARVAVGIF